jgi:hypothetical protein
MNDDSYARLAMTLDSQSMAGVCHRTQPTQPASGSLFKSAFDLLKSWFR